MSKIAQFERFVRNLITLTISDEEIESLFETWRLVIVENPIDSIDIICAIGNKRLSKTFLTLFKQLNIEVKSAQLKNILFVISCYLNDLKSVGNYLDDKEIDVNFNKFEYLLPPLHIACDHANLELLKLLLPSRQLNVNLLSKAKPHNSALHKLCESSSACEEEIFKLLIKANMSPNLCNELNETPLHVCVYYENYNLAKLLLASNANVNIRASPSLYSRTCLHYCANLDTDNLKLFKLLVNHRAGNYDLTDAYGENVLQIANKKGNINICKYIIESNLFSMQSNLLLLNLVYSTIELNCIQNLRFYITKFKFKLDIDLFLKYANLSKNFHEILMIVLDSRLIDGLNKSQVGNKLLGCISTDHVNRIQGLMEDEIMKHNWYANSRSLFQINNSYLETLINVFKHVPCFDYNLLESLIAENLYLYRIVHFDLDYFDSKFDTYNSSKKPIMTYDNEKLLLAFIKLIIYSGKLKQGEIRQFITHLIEHVFSRVQHSHASVVEYLHYQLNQLLTLKDLCRIKIRFYLSDRNVMNLYYPPPLKRYLNFEDIFFV